MKKRSLLVFSGFMALAGISSAQTPAPAPAAARPAAPPASSKAPGTLKIKGLTFTGSLRSRVESFDWFTPTTGDNAYAYSGNILRFGLSRKLDKWDWNAEFAAPFMLGLPSTATGPGAQGALGLGSNYFTANSRNQNASMVFAKQLYARVTRFGGSTASVLKVGRFEFLDGSETAPKNATLATLKTNRINQRLIGSFGWSDVGRSYDGMQYSYSKPAGTFTFMGAVPTRGVFQTDGWGWNKTAVGYSSFAKSWGTGVHSAETRVFAIYYDDWRRGVLKVDNRSAAARAGEFANIRLWTAGGNTLHLFNTKSSQIDLLAWGVAQGGKWGIQDHSAYAFDAEAGFQPKAKSLAALKPWLRGGYSVTSGDSNPTDKTHGTFFQLLPTPRPYARFPFFNMMNNIDRFGSLTLRPHAKVTITSDFHSLSLKNASDLWYAGGGVFELWTFGYQGRNAGRRQSLANLYDTSLEYRLNPRIAFTGYYGFAQGKAAMAAIYPAGKNAAFGYIEALIRF